MTEYFNTRINNNYNNYNNHNHNNVFWFQDMTILFNANKLHEFYPISSMTYAEKSNSLVRGSIYIGVVCSILSKNYLYLYLPLGIMAFTYIMFLLQKIDNESNNNINSILNNSVNKNNYGKTNKEAEIYNRNKKHYNIPNNDSRKINDTTENFENINNNNCIESTVDNPFMNPNVFSPRDINKSCSPLNNDVKMKMLNNYNKYLFKDASDIFNHRNGYRQFYTVPGNTFPNNRDIFMKWCYSRPKTCKEGNGEQCVANNYYSLRPPHTGPANP